MSKRFRTLKKKRVQKYMNNLREEIINLCKRNTFSFEEEKPTYPKKIGEINNVDIFVNEDGSMFSRATVTTVDIELEIDPEIIKPY